MAPLPVALREQLDEAPLRDIVEYVFSQLVFIQHGDETVEFVFRDGAYQRTHLHLGVKENLERRRTSVRAFHAELVDDLERRRAEVSERRPRQR